MTGGSSVPPFFAGADQQQCTETNQAVFYVSYSEHSFYLRVRTSTEKGGSFTCKLLADNFASLKSSG
ncbi:MAG: hypothetical protein WDO16_12870 [Bacteroidota bacterium]